MLKHILKKQNLLKKLAIEGHWSEEKFKKVKQIAGEWWRQSK